MYKELFKKINYPVLLDTIDGLELSRLPPWEFLRENYEEWKKDFDKAFIVDFIPFARMLNDDVIATFNIKTKSDEIYLFILPIFPTSKPFKKLENINAWLKLALEDCYQYLIEY